MTDRDIESDHFPAIVYVDSNFLVCLFYEGHELHDKALVCYFQLMNQNTVLAVSDLALDETWFKLVSCSYKKNTGRRLNPEKWRQTSFINKYLSILQKCYDFIDKYSRTEKVRLLGTDHETVKEAFELMCSIPLRPRDAFHVARMRQQDISAILTMDTDFEKVQDISVYTWNLRPT